MIQQKITGLIISAGLSRRMGKLKPLIKFDSQTFLEHIIEKLDEICEKIVIVSGFQADHIKKETEKRIESNNKALLKKITWQHNPQYKKGMLTSLQTGLKAIKDSGWILYHFVDQPDIPGNFYPDFASQVNKDYEWIQPAYRGQSGHPILFANELAKHILALKTNQSLRDLEQISRFKRKYWECDVKEILQDFDTPEHLKKLNKE